MIDIAIMELYSPVISSTTNSIVIEHVEGFALLTPRITIIPYTMVVVEPLFALF